jgi:hypothetical protein
MSRALAVFVQSVFNDGTVAPLRTPEELLDVLNQHEKRVEGGHTFLVTLADELNELAPVEVLAGQRFKVQNENELHPSQSRYLDLPLEQRVAKVLHAAKEWGIRE